MKNSQLNSCLAFLRKVTCTLVIIAGISTYAISQQVTGTITDSDGQPLIGRAGQY